MDYELLSDEILIKLLKTSDEKAFRTVYERFWKKLFFSAYKRIKSKEVAEELVQNIFVSLWNNRETVAIQKLEQYLSTAMKYSIINHIQSQVVKEKYHDYARNCKIKNNDGNTTDHALMLDELMKAIERSVAQLPAKTGEVFRLSRFESRTTKEIAETLNLSEKAVEYHITKSIKVLRTCLKDYMLWLAIALAAFYAS